MNVPCWFVFLFFMSSSVFASEALMEKHCSKCHNEEKAKGKFQLAFLEEKPTEENLERWLDCQDLVKAEEMPPEDEGHLLPADREAILAFLTEKIAGFDASTGQVKKVKPRRLNNREFAYSVRDALLLEDIGTNQPTANLIGDSLHHGFDTHGDTLGFSRFHLEQYIEAVRKIVDATILSGEMPKSKVYEISAEQIARDQMGQNTTRKIQYGENGVFNFLAPILGASFTNFSSAPETGHYRIKIRCTGKDRVVYDAKYTGFYHGDPIQLSVHLGDRINTFDLPDEDVLEIELEEWIAAGTQLKLFNPTDAFTQRGNGNFKFQYGITPDHLKENDPERYAELVAAIEVSPNKSKRKNIDTWHNWTSYWMGARPQVFSAEVEGPFYESWPPKRQVALIGENPKVEDITEILRPIAERAWRRTVRDGELDSIAEMVQEKAETLSEIDAIKEGIVAVLVSPSFLFLNLEDADQSDRFAAKLSYFLESTIPDKALHSKVGAQMLDSYEAVKSEVEARLKRESAGAFLREFPFAWLELNDINFMEPDPEHYRFYHKKRVSEDMVNEVLEFFHHIVKENRPIPELLSADYSFVNADLATIYGLNDVPRDSKFRKYTFDDGRRGGLLGMGAFLTVTADSLSTSPIHRAVYVMENFMGIHPTPPPPDVEITEPDVRQAKTIKEILAAHTADETCASCHKAIDPWGYAFENFDPTGAWRDVYTVPKVIGVSDDGAEAQEEKKGKETVTIPIDASATFRSGSEYQDVTEFREQILSEANRDRFVRCFITKLLIYANGESPKGGDLVEVDRILSKSAEYDFRIVETIAAVVDNPLFRER